MTTLKLVIALIVSVSALDNVELVQTSPSRRVPDDTDNAEPIDADVDTEADKMASSPQNDDGVGNADFDMEDSPSDSQQDNAGLDDEPSASQQNDNGKLDDEPSPGQESESDDNLDDPNFDSLLQLTSQQEPKDDVDTEADKLADSPQNDNGALDDEPSASQESVSQSDDGKLDDEPTPGEESDDKVDDPNFDSLLQLSSRQEPKDDVDTEAEKLADAPQKDDNGKLDDEPTPGQESDEKVDDPNFDSLLQLTSQQEPKDDVDIEADKLAEAEQKDNGNLDDEPSPESAPQNDDVKLDDEPSASQESDDNLDDPSFDMA
jgi:hypothetical protein